MSLRSESRCFYGYPVYHGIFRINLGLYGKISSSWNFYHLSRRCTLRHTMHWGLGLVTRIGHCSCLDQQQGLCLRYVVPTSFLCRPEPSDSLLVKGFSEPMSKIEGQASWLVYFCSTNNTTYRKNFGLSELHFLLLIYVFSKIFVF